MSMLINLTNGQKIFGQDDRYLVPAPDGQEVCGQYAPEAPFYRCTRIADHESSDRVYPHTHAAHGAYRGGMFALWQEESSNEEIKS